MLKHQILKVKRILLLKMGFYK